VYYSRWSYYRQFGRNKYSVLHITYSFATKKTGNDQSFVFCSKYFLKPLRQVFVAVLGPSPRCIVASLFAFFSRKGDLMGLFYFLHSFRFPTFDRWSYCYG